MTSAPPSLNPPPSSDPPLVSVIVAAYQQPAFLNEALRSVAAQTYPAIEIIVVDDGSGPEHTSRYQLPPNARLIIHPQRSSKAAITRNTGLREVRGQFVAFLDQDDIWLPEKIAAQVQLFRRHPDAVFCFSHFRYVDAQLHPLPEQPPPITLRRDPLRQMIWRNFIRSPSQVMVNSKSLVNIGLFDESIRGAADWDLWIRAAAAGPILADPRTLILYRRHPAQWSRSSLMMVHGMSRVMEKTQSWVLQQRPDLKWVMHKRRARWLRNTAHVQLQTGEDRHLALNFLAQALRQWPLDIPSYTLMPRALWFARHPKPAQELNACKSDSSNPASVKKPSPPPPT